MSDQFTLDEGYEKGVPSMRKFVNKMGPKFGEMDSSINHLAKTIDGLDLSNVEKDTLIEECQTIYDLIWEIHGAFCDVAMDYDLEPKRIRPTRRPDKIEVGSEV